MGDKQTMNYFLDNLEQYDGQIGGHHSDNGSPTEDGNQGVALHIFENIGVEYGYVLDIGAFSKKASNVVPIMEKYNIGGLLLDGDNKYNDPEITKVWITKDNITTLLETNNCPKNVDYISVDIDNMDYWIMKSLLEGGYKSNVIIAEFNPIWSRKEACTKKYFENTRKADGDTAYSSNYGVSLYGLVKLFSEHGYRLVHVMKQNQHGDPSSNNAFFIQERFDTENKFENQEEVLKQVFPTPFIEPFKLDGNIRKFGTNDIEIVKSKLKSEGWFIEL